MQKYESKRTLPDEQLAEEINPKRQEALPMADEQLAVEPSESTEQKPEQEQTQEISPELQSTLPLVIEDPEQQPTQPMEVEPADLEQLPAQSIDVEQQKPEQQPGPPSVKKVHRSSNMVRVWWVSLLVYLLLLISVLIGGSAIKGWLSYMFGYNKSTNPILNIQPLPTPSQSTLFDSAAGTFMDAMMHKDWAKMWSMLSPNAQRLWMGEKDFIHFEQAKYGSLTFVSYSVNTPQIQYTWRDPDTTWVYAEVVTLRVSLKVTAPRGLLSGPSNFVLNKGLFNDTLFTLVYYQDKWRVLVAGPADPNAPILVPASAPTTKLLVPIFMYHHVSNRPTQNLLDYGLTVTTTNFDAQLTWLQQQGYHSITMTELFDRLYYGKALPAHPMILSFDDGYEDMYTDALPVLLAHHYRGVFYIITGMIGGNYLTWEQVRALAQDGMQIASHTIHHVNIGQPPAWTSTQSELLLSKETLQTQLRQPIQFFCYPTGEPFHNDTVYEQQIVLADLFNDGYVGATLDPFSFDSVIQNAQTPYQLPRVRVSGGESMQLFISILNSTLYIDAVRLANGFAY